MTHKLTFATASLLLVAALGACSRSEPDEAPPVENQAEALPEPESAPLPSATQDEPAPMPTATTDANLAAEVPADVAPEPDEQMLDDATATGMTARAPRDEQVFNDTGAADQPDLD